MPSINPSLVPTVSPGNMFRRLTTDDSLAIRWLTSVDPVYFEAWNRPLADMAVRELVIAKALDQISLRLGHQMFFPFLIQPKLVGNMDIPLSWMWDLHVSIAYKWINLRLAKVERISGHNPGGSGSSGGTGPDYTGKIRLVFTANPAEFLAAEVSLYTIDYQIDSTLQYQRADIRVATAPPETLAIDPSEANTIAGFAIFRTLDREDPTVQAFFDFVAPPVDESDANSDGEYDNPAIYQMMDSTPGVFGPVALPHGTGILVDSAYNAIPDTPSQMSSWIKAFNYPYRYSASRKSASPITITIPAAMFNEFNLAVPAGDEPTGDSTGTYYPVWINRIVRNDVGADSLSFYFATYAVVDDTPSTAPIEFAMMTLLRTYQLGRVVSIDPIANLLNEEGTDSASFNQHFGRGHVVLSDQWSGTSDNITEFFDAFIPLIGEPAQILFTKEDALLSSYSLSRVPKYIPTMGESQALKGTSARKVDAPSHPSDANRYVTENDQGEGDKVDFSAVTGITPNPDIERYGWKGSLVSKKVKLIVNASGSQHDYEHDILPRLRCLLGRDPIFSDSYFNGTRWLIYNGDTWTG